MLRRGQSCLVELLQGGAGHSFEGEVVPVLSACRTTGDNVERVLQVGLESQKWGWQLDFV